MINSNLMRKRAMLCFKTKSPEKLKFSIVFVDSLRIEMIYFYEFTHKLKC